MPQDGSRKLDATRVPDQKDEEAPTEERQGQCERDSPSVCSDTRPPRSSGRSVFERHMLREFLDPAIPEDERPLPTDLIREDEGASSHSEEEYEEDIIEPRTLNEITTITDKTSPWSSLVSEEEPGPERQLVDLGPGDQRSVGIDCLRRGDSRRSSFSSVPQGDNQSVVTTLSPCVGLHAGEESPWAGAEGFRSLNSSTKPENGSCDCDRAFNTTSIDQNVEFRAASEELLGFPADPKTTEKEKEENGEVVNKDRKDEEESASDGICVTSASARAGWGGNTESFSDDSSEDSLEVPKKSVKAKIASYPSFLKHPLYSRSVSYFLLRISLSSGKRNSLCAAFPWEIRLGL